MQILDQVYCRAFQTALRLAMPVLPYRDPKILRSTAEVPAELRSRGLDSVLIVTDSILYALGKTAPLERCLREAGIRCAVYSKTVSNPTVHNVEEARAVYLEHGCQALIGFGGGSAIDCAKAVGARIARPSKPVARMRGILKVLRPIPPLIAIPTTAGTGSEVTLATVITDSEHGYKFPINDFPLIPKVAVLDVENTRTMPPSMTATTGMDALTHAVEAFIGRSTTAATRSDALEATRLIFANLETAYRDGDNLEAREHLSTAAFLAGSAFTKSYVGYVHAVAHSLGGQYNVPHGLANAVLLPNVLAFYGEAAYQPLHRLAVVAGLTDANDSPRAGAERFIQAVRDMERRLDIPTTIPEIRREDVPRLARYADKEANPLYPVPVLLDAGELERFYYEVMEERNEPGTDPTYFGYAAGLLFQRRHAARGKARPGPSAPADSHSGQ